MAGSGLAGRNEENDERRDCSGGLGRWRGGVVEAMLEEPSLAVAFVVAMGLAVLCVWARTVRKRRPRTARAGG